MSSIIQPPLKKTLKALVYAPGTKTGRTQMISILQSLHLPYQLKDDRKINDDAWILLPMKSNDDDLTSSSLGDKLENALDETRELIGRFNNDCNESNVYANEAVLFLGMDSPELPMEEIIYGLQIASGNRSCFLQIENEHISEQNESTNNDKEESFTGKAHLCPAHDGGYGLLSIPKHAPSSKIFAGVRWSHPLTAVSQLKALTDNSVNVSLGKLMYDVDEPEDVQNLAIRLVHSNNDGRTSSGDQNDVPGDVLTTSSSGTSARYNFNFPHHTLKQLQDLNLLQVDATDTYVMR